MMDYLTIKKAKMGDGEAISKIITYYIPVIKSFCKDEDFLQISLMKVVDGIEQFKNKKS